MGAISKDTLPMFHNKMLACMSSAIPKYAHYVSTIFGKRKERAYWNIDLATHFYDANIILSSVNLKKINTHIFSILNNTYLQKHENVKLYL